MASHEITALQCPSCGSSNTGPTKPLAFGAEFSCAKCGGTSVLIINRALLPVDSLQKSGDQVCAMCGRVADRKARFCQDGHKLVRTCLKCNKEFAAHHQRCDYCGWPQDVQPGTPEAHDLELDSAIEDLSDPTLLLGDPRGVVQRALCKIGNVSVTSGCGKRAVASIVRLLQNPQFGQANAILAWNLLAHMGADAAETLPLLLQAGGAP
jgi:DNA-directed RNA polymerase subunit RPC12/RpoP